MDIDENSAPIAFKSYKSRHVTRFVLAAEVIAFSDLFDEAFVLKDSIEMEIANNVQLHLLTDSKSLFDIIRKKSRTNENRLMQDVYAARQIYKEQDISNIGFVWSNQNVSDRLAKSLSQEALRNVITNGKLSVKVKQWIIRKPKSKG